MAVMPNTIKIDWNSEEFQEITAWLRDALDEVYTRIEKIERLVELQKTDKEDGS